MPEVKYIERNMYLAAFLLLQKPFSGVLSHFLGDSRAWCLYFFRLVHNAQGFFFFSRHNYMQHDEGSKRLAISFILLFIVSYWSANIHTHETNYSSATYSVTQRKLLGSDERNKVEKWLASHWSRDKCMTEYRTAICG